MNEALLAPYVEQFKEGSFRNNNYPKEKDELLYWIIDKKAFRDATIAERFNTSSLIMKNGKEVKKILYEEIRENQKEILADFDKWHNLICENDEFGEKYGVWQKLINMTFKYMYCVKEYFPEFDEVWDKCHCPLDSRILEGLYYVLKAQRLNGTPCDELKQKVTKWNSITPDTYKDVQNKLLFICNKNNISRLEYDFIIWA